MTVRNFRTPFTIEPYWHLESAREADGTTERACYVVELDPSRTCAQSVSNELTFEVLPPLQTEE